jgi:hypothetical protein
VGEWVDRGAGRAGDHADDADLRKPFEDVQRCTLRFTAATAAVICVTASSYLKLSCDSRSS